MSKITSIAPIVGKGYRDIWNFKGRYKVIKGSRASKKSKTTALWIIYHMMKYKGANTLVVRKVFRTLKNSCYSDLKWACDRLQVKHLWEFKTNPMEITYKPTGQQILFRGFDDPLKITSISVSNGSLCFVWLEEAYELTSEDAFNMLDESIRGTVEAPLFKQIILTLNPWNEKHWIKKRFFDSENNENKLATTTNYLCNEWLDKSDLKLFEDMKQNNPRRYQTAGLGEWGHVDGLVYENWVEREFDYRELLKNSDYELRNGLDFGYIQDPTAFINILINEKTKEIYIFDEHVQKGLVNTEIATMIKYKGYAKEKIIADSAEPKSIEEIRRAGIRRIEPAIKGKDSIMYGIQKIQQYKMYVHPRCVNTILELSLYCWDNKNGEVLNKPVDVNNHLLDALRYAVVTEEKKKGINVSRKVIY